MKGLLFDKFDIGRGGPDGFVHHGYKWCVEHEGKKHHVSKEVCEGGIYYNVKPCDGSCERKREELPLDVEKAFLEKVQEIQKRRT